MSRDEDIKRLKDILEKADAEYDKAYDEWKAACEINHEHETDQNWDTVFMLSKKCEELGKAAAIANENYYNKLLGCDLRK